ncbi:hypothetical protein [Nocardia bovistercoris]|uniref:Uncharacterized protein n=1 Tax=Nocardia bovistercoris TaxID=2785916 RepID=A0A931I7U8_9NOCA|nr:hypothetical protein [Nocardia bovistercoris]MBH0775886.1 hypothetical protein [Nocardia bovistercoris]
MFRNDNENDREEWAGASVVFVLIVLVAVVAMILVSTADFGDRDRPTTPRTPGPCEPFCPRPTIQSQP